MKGKNDYIYAPQKTEFWVARIYRQKDENDFPEDITEKYAHSWFARLMRIRFPGLWETKYMNRGSAQSAAYVLRVKAAKDKANAGYQIDARAEIICSF